MRYKRVQLILFLVVTGFFINNVNAEDLAWPKYKISDFTSFSQYYDSMLPHLLIMRDPTSPKEAYEHFKRQAFTGVKKYITHQNKRVRWNVYTHLHEFIIQETSLQQRQTMFLVYLDGLNDTEELIKQSVARRMNTFGADIFNDAAKKKVLSLFYQQKKSGHAYDHIVLSVGIIKAKQTIPLLKQSKSRFKDYVLARLGDKQALANVLAIFAHYPRQADMHKHLYRHIKLLGYTKQPEAIQMLKRYLNVHTMIPGSFDYPAEYVKGWAAETFVDIIDLPVKEHLARRPESIRLCKKWLRKNYNQDKHQDIFLGEIRRWQP